MNSPELCVVVPVYNGASDLKLCLSALAGSDRKDFDVLIVDDGSTEDVKSIVEQFAYRYVRINGPSGPARARNYGVSLVQNRLVLFVDADVCVHSDTLTRILARFKADPSLDAVIGSYDEAPAKSNFLSQYKNLFHHYVHQQSDGDINTFWSGCGAIKREVFQNFGGFDERRYRRPAIEDIELGTWLTNAGYRIVLDRQIKVKHLKLWTFWNLLKTDIFDRGVPWTRLMLRVGALANTLNVKPKQRLSVLLSYLAVLTLVATFWWPVAGLISSGLMLTVTLINFDFYHFFLTRTGPWFTLRVIPLHWLYFGYCGFSFAWGTLSHWLARDSQLSGPGSAAKRPERF